MSFSKSYAKALVEIADMGPSPSQVLDQTQAELSGLAGVILKDRSISIALGSPATSRQEKVHLVKQIAEGLGLSVLTNQFLRLLAKKGRVADLAEIVEALDGVRLAAAGGIRGLVETADSLTDADIASLAQAFGKKLGKKVQFTVKNNPGLLAGVRVAIQGVTYDGSLRVQLEKIQARLAQGALRFLN